VIMTSKVYDRMMTQIEQKNVLQVQIKNIKWSCVNLKKLTWKMENIRIKENNSF